MAAESPTNRRLARLFRVGLAACLAGLAYAVGASLRTGADPVRLAAVPVLYRETVVPPCGAGEAAQKRLTVISAYLPRDAADAVTALSVEGPGGTRRWDRAAGTCRPEDPGPDAAPEPCPTEACREGICAVRLPVPGAGPFRVDVAGPAGRIGGGRVAAAGEGVPALPRLDVARSGREVSLGGEPGAVARISAIRSGRVAADVPKVLGEDGRGRIAVPDGADALRVSVSRGDDAGVAQAGALLPGPFDGSCR